MAKELQNTSNNISHSFIKGLNKDSDPSFVQEGMWTHAINASNNTIEGDLGTLSNESSNYLCSTTGVRMPATVVSKYIVGAIYLFSDKHIIFTAGHDNQGKPVMSEIGLFEEDRCIYRPIVQSACLSFDKRFLISGASREKEDCSWQVYWADGYNPDRYLNIGDPKTWPAEDAYWNGAGALNNYYTLSNGTNVLWPGVQWEQKCGTGNDCEYCVDTNTLNCEDTRLARLVQTPCLNLSLGTQGGTLANGTYFAIVAYAIKGQKVTDYFSPSNNQFVYYPNDLQGSLNIDVSVDNENFDEFILVLVQTIDQGTIAKQIGIYSTSTNKITIDQIDNSLISVPIEQLPITTPVYETSDQIAEVNNYLLRVGPRSKFDFNYQPLANLIKTRWASVEYPADYYTKGGNKTNYLRDEVYAFFIRWVYNTGDKSASYHIPGRPPKDFLIPGTSTSLPENSFIPYGNDNALSTDEKVFEVYNTASSIPSTLVGTTTDDGGTIIDAGEMGYWESTEEYPDNRPDIWNPSSHCWTGNEAQSGYYDLCGKPIRHHKFPENFLNNAPANGNVNHFRSNSNTTQGDQYFIRLLGVYFENIIIPKDNEGNDIPGIVGYEILRGSREGNKTIVAKGMLNNFRDYKIEGSAARGRTGLYANYPFNTIVPLGSSTNSSDHNYGVNDPYIKQPINNTLVNNQTVIPDLLTFHSPDTMFRSPYLSTTELKVYGHLQGTSVQAFITPDQHPKFKLLSNVVPFIIYVVGVAEGIVSMIGKRTLKMPEILPASGASDAAGAALAAATTGYNIAAASASTYNAFWSGYYTGGTALLDIPLMITGGYPATQAGFAEDALMAGINAAAGLGGASAIATAGSIELPSFAYLPLPLRILGGINQMAFYFAEGADAALKIIYAIVPYDQYALQSVAHGYYSQMVRYQNTDVIRFKTPDSFYIRDNIQEVNRYQDFLGNWKSYSINNLKRTDSVVLRTISGPYVDVAYPDGVNIGPKFIGTNLDSSGNLIDGIDKSLVTIGTLQNSTPAPLYPQGSKPTFDTPQIQFSMPIASHYGAIKGRVRNQYGQLDSLKQIVVTTCEQKIVPNQLPLIGPFLCQNEYYTQRKIVTSPVFFNGDTYINRYTEKNNMFFFYDWLYGQPDGFEFNYYIHQMIPQPRFMVNSTNYDVSDLIPNLSNINNFTNPPGTGVFPTRFYNLDTENYDYTNDDPGAYPGFFRVKDSYFYLANSSVRDFFVESDVLVDFRENSNNMGEKHYDPYRFTDFYSLFNMNPDIITIGNIYRYDYSLSVSKMYNQYFSSGNLQNRYYNPEISDLCYTYYPDRIIYSLQQQEESFKDSWFIYLVNNYKEFKSQISGVKPINKSGIFITFKNDSPLMFQGLDQLQTDLGTKLTIGDGGLFSQPPQSVSNADKPFEYGSSQNRLSVISTPAGIYYVSQNQGKIFAYGQGLKEISQIGLKWWFSNFLPYKLTDDFPNYPYQDNPVSGIGCQATFDNQNTILYFTKKDYKLLPEYVGRVNYVPLITTGKNKGKGDYFTLDGNGQYLLGDPILFEDASWTISFDPKNEFWISFHDWHPDLCISTKHTFITTKNTGLWKHNDVCNNFCTYYGKPYKFEVELPIVTGQTVTTVKSFEYILESYRRSEFNCIDQHHVLDYNFDEAVVYNSEQVSGYLNLNLFPKNNITLSLEYPKLNPSNLSSFDILFTKEENKYRFNQFWDITKDRAEFPIGSNYPPTGPVIPGTTLLQGNYSSENTWVTSANGYDRVLNSNNMDYAKPQLQRKKFRHYLNFLTLRKNVSTDVNMILKITNSKNQISLR